MLLAMIAAAGTWGWFGNLPSRVSGDGILITRNGRVFDAMAPIGGVLEEITVTVDDVVEKNQIIAIMSQRDLEIQSGGGYGDGEVDDAGGPVRARPSGERRSPDPAGSCRLGSSERVVPAEEAGADPDAVAGWIVKAGPVHFGLQGAACNGTAGSPRGCWARGKGWSVCWLRRA
jgi:hypothetical protein